LGDAGTEWLMGCSSYVLGSFDIGRLSDDVEEREGVGRGEAESVVLPEAPPSILRGRT
jgi:hypothetical protein